MSRVPPVQQQRQDLGIHSISQLPPPPPPHPPLHPQSQPLPPPRQTLKRTERPPCPLPRSNNLPSSSSSSPASSSSSVPSITPQLVDDHEQHDEQPDAKKQKKVVQKTFLDEIQAFVSFLLTILVLDSEFLQFVSEVEIGKITPGFKFLNDFMNPVALRRRVLQQIQEMLSKSPKKIQKIDQILENLDESIKQDEADGCDKILLPIDKLKQLHDFLVKMMDSTKNLPAGVSFDFDRDKLCFALFKIVGRSDQFDQKSWEKLDKIIQFSKEIEKILS